MIHYAQKLSQLKLVSLVKKNKTVLWCVGSGLEVE